MDFPQLSWVCGSAGNTSGPSFCLCPRLHHLLTIPAPLIVTQHLLGTLMSTSSQDGEVLELSCWLGELQISIKGPADPATRLLRQLTRPGSIAAASPRSTLGSFEVVSNVDSQPEEISREFRDSIASSFSPCPAEQLHLAARLTGSTLSGEDRVRRAWKAGQWAKAVLGGRICTPNRSVQLDIRPRFYAILRAEGLSKPLLCHSAASYWRVIGDIATSNSISHAFPSESEAKIYFAGAGVTDYEVRA